MRMSVERWWNDTDSGTQEYSGERKTFHIAAFAHHKSHMDRPGIEPGPPR